MLNVLLVLALRFEEAELVSQLERFEVTSDAGIGAVGTRASRAFAVPALELDDWRLVTTAFDVFHALMQRPQTRAFVLRGLAKRKTASGPENSALDAAGGLRRLGDARTTGLSSLFVAAFQVLPFRLWVEAQGLLASSSSAATASFAREELLTVTTACVAGSKLAVRLLLHELYPSSGGDAAAWVLRLVAAALTHNHLHAWAVPRTLANDPLGALCHVFAASYSEAHSPRWKASVYVELYAKVGFRA